MLNNLSLKAYAKVNLGLDVLRRREDGYHDLRMIMQTIKLYDNINMERIPEDEIRLTCNLHYLPTDERNLVYKAVKLMKETYGITEGVKVDIEKHIPVAAGMAGGSTDAAAAFVGMNQLFDLHVSQDELMKLGVTLGADIPYCIMRGTALSEGIGEILTQLPPLPGCWILVAKPEFSMSTKFVYEHLVLDENTVHPDIDGMIDAIRKNDLAGITDRLGNVLESVTGEHFPEIGKIKALMMKQGAMGALMSGSGSTVFGIFAERGMATRAARAVHAAFDIKQTAVVRPFNKTI